MGVPPFKETPICRCIYSFPTATGFSRINSKLIPRLCFNNQQDGYIADPHPESQLEPIWGTSRKIMGVIEFLGYAASTKSMVQSQFGDSKFFG